MEIENELNRFRETSERINNQMNDVNRKLILEDNLDVYKQPIMQIHIKT